MTDLDFFIQKLPSIKGWIDELLIEYSGQSKPLNSFGFQRLGHYFSRKTIESTKVVIVNKVPVPPLTKYGLDVFKDFELGNYAGITYQNTYFVNSSSAQDESLHFHELVHVVQWRILGIERFLLLYALSLKNGYVNNPMERMAYDFQNLFEADQIIEGLEDKIEVQLSEMSKQILGA